MEEWKSVTGFEGLYEVSNTGKVKSLTRIVTNSGSYSGFIIKHGKELKQSNRHFGYHSVSLSKEGKNHFKVVHRLVAEAFIENPLGMREVNHKDLDKSNNHVSNLEWCDRVYNVNHFYRNKNKASQYPGISYESGRNLWFAYVDILDRRLMLGRHETELKAKEYRDEFIKKLKRFDYEKLV